MDAATTARQVKALVEYCANAADDSSLLDDVSERLRRIVPFDIAADLFLSPHTVRDHLKAIFAKVGVSTRGELVAKLFAEHYEPTLHAPEAHVAHVYRSND